MKKALVMTIVAALTLGIAAPASAAIRITKIYFDSPGADTGSNTSLNAEYVVIKNTGTTRKTLTGWTLRDASRHIYKFPTFRLGAGKSVKVHTGKGANTLGNLASRALSRSRRGGELMSYFHETIQQCVPPETIQEPKFEIAARPFSKPSGAE